MKRLPTVIITILVLAAILWPGSLLPDSRILRFDKIAHFGIFLAWTVAIVHDFNLRWYTALGMAVVFALLTEVIQLGVDGRTFDLMDLLADTAGAGFGVANSSWIIRLTKWVLRL